MMLPDCWTFNTVDVSFFFDTPPPAVQLPAHHSPVLGCQAAPLPLFCALPIARMVFY